MGDEHTEYTKSTAQLSAEQRLEEATGADDKRVAPHLMSTQPSYGVPEGGGYLGTDPIYQNAADDRQRAYDPEDDWQRQMVTADTSDANEQNLPYVPEHFGTGAPKLADHGPVKGRSTVPTPPDEADEEEEPPSAPSRAVFTPGSTN